MRCQINPYWGGEGWHPSPSPKSFHASNIIDYTNKKCCSSVCCGTALQLPPLCTRGQIHHSSPGCTPCRVVTILVCDMIRCYIFFLLFCCFFYFLFFHLSLLNPPVQVLHAQLELVPEDFFDAEISRGNFLVPSLSALLQVTMASQPLNLSTSQPLESQY